MIWEKESLGRDTNLVMFACVVVMFACVFYLEPLFTATISVEATVNLHYTDTRYNDKIRYTGNLTSTETLSQKVTVSQKLCSSIIIQYFKQHMFWIFVRIALSQISNTYGL